MARDEKDYMTNPSLIQRVTSYITQGGRPEYQEATEHPKTLSVYNEPYAKQNGAALGTFEYYVDDNGRLTKGVTDMGISDPFTKINSQIDMNVSLQAPKVKIDGNRVVVQAPKEILSSPLVSQIKEELRSLKGSDLKSAEVQNAIKALNEEISTGLKDSLLNSATGWTRDQYNDYQYARQSVAGTNPMRSSNKIKGYDKDGNIIMKTPQEWVDYYRQFYNTDEREKAYEKSFYSSDPYERTMALVMGQGNKVPVYGFDTAEKMGEGWKALVNQMGKFPEGTLRLLAEDNDTRRLEGIVNNKRIPIESMRKFNINTEDEFNAKKESIKGKSWDELSDDDKAFIAILGVSREGELEREADTTEAMKDYRGSRTNTFAWDTNQQDYERAERKAARQISTEDLNNATSEDKEKSRDAIDKILSDNSFEKYRTARNNYDTWQGYQDWAQEGEKELASTADWSGSEQWWGNLAGTIGRYLWENAVVQGATGGFAMNAISDKIGAHIVGKLAQRGISPTSRFGRNAMQFTANLIGTVPEDILQTSVDNVLTYNIKDNTALLDPQQMSENFRNNLIFMSLFNAGKAGFSAVRRAYLAKQIAKAADLDEELVIGKLADADDVARAASKGQEIKIDGDKVSTVDVNGNETVLKNITPEEANIAQQTIRPQEAAETVTTVAEETIEPVKKKTRKEWKENPTYDQDYSLRRAEDVMEGRTTLDDYLEEQKERMWEALKNSNQGTETFYHRDETGQIDGRNTVSYNGTLYRQLYEEYGGRPTKAEFGEAFDDVIKNGENSKYYEGFKEFDTDGDYSRGYNAGNEEIDTILALKEDIESAPAKATESAPEPEPGTGTARTEVEEPMVEAETTRVETEEPKTATGAGTAVGETLDETSNIRVRNVDDGLKMRVSPTPPNVRALHSQTLGAAMRDFSQVHLPEFQRRFPGVEVSDFDWVFHNTRNGLEPNQIVGMIDPETGREVTDQMIKAMQWFGDQPFMKDLRKASRDALGLEGDFNMLGYLPHSTYDPSNLSFDEALTGQLWRQYTGASMIGDNGQYKGFGGDFNSRYRTFASNMLWDARGKDVAAAKLMEEAEMDGKSITPEQAVKAVEGQQDIQRKVSDSATTKELEAALSSDTDVDEIDFKKIDEATKKQAQNSGLGKAIHDNYSEVYYGANSATVAKQSGATRQAFDTLGNTMRNTQIIDGRGRRMSLYDWGGADFVYAERNAIELVNRYMREGGDLRDMLIEFVENHSHRTTEYAEAVADRWMGKLGDTPGRLTKAAAIRSLSGSMKWEAMGRIRKFLTMAKYDEFNSATKKTIDSFLFGHMQMDTIKTSQKIGKKLSSALNAMTSMRYRALFYGNVKNALLQTSELNRLFTTFKWGDVATMAKRMVTDANFKARVDDIYDAVAPQQSSFRSALYDDYAEVAGNMETTQKGVSFKEGGKKMVEAVDNIGLAPIEAAEAFKNRMMVAALVQEADSLGLTGDDALRHIRGRFERVALAMDELGRIGMASNPIARTALFLQNFQIRELGMHIYNLSDEWAKGTKLPSRILNASKYLSKVLGAKLATTLILARLGYSSSQTLGYDPFGVLEDYTGMNEEDLEGFDYFMKSPLFAGGMTSLISDMYFMARKAYEESNPKTISEEAEENISGESSWGLEGLSFDDLMGLGQNFIPGNVFFNRINQMNEMMDTGWATSVSGNKMYTAPSDALNTILGYLFGRSATQNAQQYNQTYGDNLLQTLGRMRPGRGFGEFDPIDSKNYSDWFKGDGNDRQQFEKGRRYFQQQRDRILDEYEDAIRKSYASNDDIAEAKNNMNQSLEDLYNQLDRFVDAYEKKNGTIDSAMTKQIINLLNTGRDVLGDTPEQAQERSLEEYNKALERYSQGGFSPVGTYTGPSESQPNKELKYQGSPQYRTAVSGKYTLNSEAVAVLKEADKVLSDVRKELKQAVSDAYDAKDYDRLAEVQKQYLTLFDKAVAPVIAVYGNSILSSTDVVNQLKDMLSTGTVSRSGDLIPSDQYRKDKYGRYRSMPLETVDVKKWAQQRYSDDIYKQPTVRSYTAAGDDIMDIRRLISQGKSDRARARALQLKVRVDNQKRTISREDYNWLLDFLNNGGE